MIKHLRENKANARLCEGPMCFLVSGSERTTVPVSCATVAGTAALPCRPSSCVPGARAKPEPSMIFHRIYDRISSEFTTEFTTDFATEFTTEFTTEFATEFTTEFTTEFGMEFGTVFSGIWKLPFMTKSE